MSAAAPEPEVLEKCLRSPGLAGHGEGEGRGRKKGTGLPQTEKKTQAGKRKIKRNREWPDVNLAVNEFRVKTRASSALILKVFQPKDG